MGPPSKLKWGEKKKANSLVVGDRCFLGPQRQKSLKFLSKLGIP